MRASTRLCRHAGELLALLCAVPVAGIAQEPAPAPARAIPGITAEDRFPQACVSCHLVLPDGHDVRLSTLVKQWEESVDSLLLVKSQAASPARLRLKGKHPDVQKRLGDIPGACLSCHGRGATAAPPFGQLLHRIHLTGDGNVFLARFDGECTHCHKLNPASGAWTIPSGPEP